MLKFKDSFLLEPEEAETSTKLIMKQAESIMDIFSHRFFPNLDLKVAKRLSQLNARHGENDPNCMFLKTQVKDKSPAYKWMTNADVEQLMNHLFNHPFASKYLTCF
jgi:hypothetical protein